MKSVMPFLFFRKYSFSLLNLKVIFILSFLVFSFIFVLEPLGFVNYASNKLLASLGFGFITLICLLIGNRILKKLMYKLLSERWIISYEIIYTILLLLIISIANLLYFSFLIDSFKINLVTIFHTLILTVSIGIFPIVAMVLIRYNQTLKNNLSRLIESDDKLDKAEKSRRLTFKSLNKTDKDFAIYLVDFLFLEAIRNHVHIYYKEEGEIKTKSIRNTLTNIDEQLSENSIFRCHRSFLINLSHIKNAKGNSNGYKIYIHDYELPIPVSRKYTSEFQEIIY